MISTAVRWLAALLLGLVIGSLVNMGLLMLGQRLVPPPAGMDTSTMEGLKAAIPLFGPQHFLFPFLAHALGTLVGAFVAARLPAPGRPEGRAYTVGLFFLAGGTANVLMLPAPAWFNALDLLGAYLPMAWAGQALAGLGRKRRV